MHGFDIYFSGETIAGEDPAEVKTRIAELFGLSDDKLEALFSGKPRRIKTNISSDEAAKYRQAFFKTGALVGIVPTGSGPPPPASAATPRPEPAKDDIQLFPANTGSLIDTAKPTPEFDFSRADQLSLAPSGTPTEDIQDEPAFDWSSVRDVEVLPPNTGSLEDCTENKQTVEIPDISKIKLVE